MTDEPHGPIFRLPRSTSARVLAGVMALVFFSAGAIGEYLTLRDETVTSKDRAGVERTLTRAERWPSIALWAVLMALGPALTIGHALTPSLVIREDGIELDRRDGKFLAWDQVGSCHWGQFQPGHLFVHGPGWLFKLPVGAPHRAEVEAALRRFGKWRD